MKIVRLIEVTNCLERSCKLFVVAKNAAFIAHKTLGVLGIENWFSGICGSEKIGTSRPTLLQYSEISKEYDFPMHAISAIGDLYNVDLHAPVSIGCAGILVESMEVIYNLPIVFSLAVNILLQSQGVKVYGAG